MTGRGLTAKQAAFVSEYLIDLNASAAARRAGYAIKRCDAIGYENLRKREISEAIRVAQQERAERTELAADDVLKQWATIATANPADLIRYRVRACRHCHGTAHHWQWVSEHEWEHANAKAEEAGLSSPSAAGGFGYSPQLRPVATCFHCLGEGITDVVIPDTRDLSPAAARLYAGVKQTKDGIEIKMRDQDAALVNVARHLGMLRDRLAIGGDEKAPPVQSVNLSADEFRKIAAELAGKV